ncbi:MAG: AI-2E family transporter [Halarsenatibacteraceae bacterium]
MFQNRFFKLTAAVIMLLAIFFIINQIPQLADFFSGVFHLVIIPLLLATFFYYLLRPLVRFLYKYIDNKTFSILLTIAALLILVFFITYFAGSIIYTEVMRLVRFLSDYENIAIRVSELITEVDEIEFLSEIDVEGRLVQFARDIGNRVTGYNFMGLFDSLAQMGVIVFLTPFLVVYFLKDDRLLFKKFLRLIPKKRRRVIKEIIGKIDKTFAIYIPSQLLVGAISGVIMFIGYLIIGMPNALGLAFILAVASVIPFIGPAIGVAPAVFIALTTSWIMLLQVGILMTVVQMFENNLVRPILQGGMLNTHPIAVIIAIVIASISFGFLGALVAVPVYVSIREAFKIILNQRGGLVSEIGND